MDEFTLEIDGKREHFGAVWVHLQEPNDVYSASYTVTVPKWCLEEILDPYIAKKENESWKAYIQRNIEDFGTFIVEEHLKAMADYLGEKKSSYRWVIATVDNIAEEEEYLKFFGRTVPFRPRS